MERTRVKQALNAEGPVEGIMLKGWIRTKRESKGAVFLELNDGSCRTNLQIVVDPGVAGTEELDSIATGAAVEVTGSLTASPGKGQKWEVQAEQLKLIGIADQETYPLQKKRHSDEFLRGIAHLRSRTNKYGAMNRIRSELSFAVHQYFRERGFYYIHTPIITGSDCEGAGEMFVVTALDPDREWKSPVDFGQDFFAKKAHLTVSGQLPAESLACSLGDVYTFGPTFRAENSNTSKHAAEFWMVEPEVAFADLQDIMDMAQDFIQSLVGQVRHHCSEDLELFSRFVDQGLEERLERVLSQPFERISYTRALEVLQGCRKKFEYPVQWGLDLQAEHERFLCEEHFHGPLIVHDYPASIKPFYMRVNDDSSTVAAMDVLLPRVGEIIGGSQREERLEVLDRRIQAAGLSFDEYWWYRDLRRFGSVPHAGFGLGFERLLMFTTGVSNIRDVLPFPRTPNMLEF